MIALVPFECPQCERHYRVELDFVKMRRLNRVAVCRGCEGRYTLNIRLEKSSGPTEPDPYASERSTAKRTPARKSAPRRQDTTPPDHPVPGRVLDNRVVGDKVFDDTVVEDAVLSDRAPSSSWPDAGWSFDPYRFRHHAQSS